jgi:hypothetical protein
VTSTIIGALVGLGIGVSLLAPSGIGWDGIELGFYLSVAGGWIGGRFFPRLEVEDPPVSPTAGG